VEARDDAAACAALDEVATRARDAATRASLAREGAPVVLAAALAAVVEIEAPSAFASRSAYLLPLLRALRCVLYTGPHTTAFAW
jgi:hypothetical protein